MARSDAGTERAGGTVACGSGVAPGLGDRGPDAALYHYRRRRVHLSYIFCVGSIWSADSEVGSRRFIAF